MPHHAAVGGIGGNSLIHKTEFGVIRHFFGLTGQHQTLAALGAGIQNGLLDELTGIAVVPVAGNGVDAEDHLPFTGGIMEGCVGIHLIPQIRLVGDEAIHKGNQLVPLEHEPEMVGIMGQAVGKFFLGSRLCRWEALRLHPGDLLQIGNIAKNPRIWIPPTLASMITGPIATCIFRLQMNGAEIASGMGTCGLVGPIGVYTGWVNDVASGAKAAITAMDWIGLLLICIVLPAILSWLFGLILRKIGWIKEGDLALNV